MKRRTAGSSSIAIMLRSIMGFVLTVKATSREGQRHARTAWYVSTEEVFLLSSAGKTKEVSLKIHHRRMWRCTSQRAPSLRVQIERLSADLPPVFLPLIVGSLRRNERHIFITLTSSSNSSRTSLYLLAEFDRRCRSKEVTKSLPAIVKALRATARSKR